VSAMGAKTADASGRDGDAGACDAGTVAGERQVLDQDHLRRMTLGDDRLEREVLQIFVRQTLVMLERIAGGEPALVAAAAHTLSGSARGIGAWRLARAAERLEASSGEEQVSEAMAELKAASLEASVAIAVRLGAAS
jgi:HPt (histidine-containing phosphotransfer) domain-containing protein